MKKKMGLRLALIAVSALVLNACGVGIESSDETKAQEVRDAKVQEDRYNRIKGVYEGVISNEQSGLKPMRASLSLYIFSVQEGKHADGTPKVRPELRGRFKLLDTIGETDTLTLSGDYNEMGELKLSTLAASAGTGAAANQLSILGRIDGNQVRINVLNLQGLWGVFEGRMVSSEASAPADGDKEDYRQRLLAIYRQVEGTYSGSVITERASQRAPGGTVEVERYPVELTLIVQELPGANGALVPSLVGFYHRTENPDGAGDRSLTVEYHWLTGDIALRNGGGGTGSGSGTTTSPGAPAGYGIFSISGKINERKLIGTQSDKFGTHRIELAR